MSTKPPPSEPAPPPPPPPADEPPAGAKDDDSDAGLRERLLEAALKDQRAEMEKKAFTKAEKEQVQLAS